MMTLKFPTMAEQAITRFEQSVATTSLADIATSMGAEREVEWPANLLFHFDDDTTLKIVGRGRNHTYEALLP